MRTLFLRDGSVLDKSLPFFPFFPGSAPGTPGVSGLTRPGMFIPAKERGNLMKEARIVIEQWRQQYNRVPRPQMIM